MSVSMVLGPGLVMDATLVLITAPMADVVSVDELKTMLGITSDGSNDLLEAMRDAVIDTLDAEHGWLGRALCPQTWELRLPYFPSGKFDLPYPVLTELTSIKYDDSAGVEHTLVEDTDYQVLGLGGHFKASVAPVFNGYWPTARGDFESVRVRYVCGYAEAAMPKAIKSAIALAVQNLQSVSERNLFLSREETPGVRSRQWIVSEAAGIVIRRSIGDLLANFHVRG